MLAPESVVHATGHPTMVNRKASPVEHSYDSLYDDVRAATTEPRNRTLGSGADQAVEPPRREEATPLLPMRAGPGYEIK